MKNPQYTRLLNNDSLAGFMRVTVEYLPAGSERWQLEEIEHDEKRKLSTEPVGIANLKRPML